MIDGRGMRAASLALALATLLGCDGGARRESAEARVAPARETAPQPAVPDTPAGRLAHQVWRAAGGERLGEVAQLDFRFVVVEGDARVVDAMHRWDRRRDRDRVTWTARDGTRFDAIVDLRARAACGAINGAAARGEALRELSEKAYQRWVNDSYWLAMPLKLLDPGVRVAEEPPREIDGRPHRVLVLSFGNVGLTPRDRYWVYVDPESGRVTRWDMLLEGQAPPPKTATWEDHRRVGPLVLAHDHATGEGGTRHVRFEDTAAHAEVRPDDFRSVAGCPSE